MKELNEKLDKYLALTAKAMGKVKIVQSRKKRRKTSLTSQKDIMKMPNTSGRKETLSMPLAQLSMRMPFLTLGQG